MKTNRTLHAMRRDRWLVMVEARDAHSRQRTADASERVATARRMNRMIVHYLRHAYREGSL